MPMDATDKRLVNGFILVMVVGTVAYFAPWYGYQEQEKKEEEQRKLLQQQASKWDKYFPPMHPAHYGQPSNETPPPVEGTYLEERRTQYGQDIEETTRKIEGLQKASAMSFPEWSNIPEKERKNPGVYFFEVWQRKREELLNIWRRAGVECLDEDIGFGPFKGYLKNMDENKTREYLRELFIAEKIIRLCVEAKQRQQGKEVERNIQPEAFMRIMSVTLEASAPTGPSELVPNTNPKEKDPLTGRTKRYNLKFWRPFIQEYPVKIELQCDVNTFERFLHSVRSAGQFLVIRNLEIVSPYLNESKTDRSEITRFQAKSIEGKSLNTKDEHILVRISAAGMDFFDPEKLPDGLYKSGKEPGKPVRRPRAQREIPTGNTAP